ncbi:thioredoxin family protein [Neobacillus sp. PS3-34]|uniref:thioredoxin family protein n=1 Tax=Neobacillus sp. PS3-34 TaxID=3070678 RepID=UPI0027E0AA9B|nr:thioredoxin family protein [Neobacillus sp. PS3-34]WML50114.1 thioredoxin family protein [Neobacillus sp. PS3-34]
MNLNEWFQKGMTAEEYIDSMNKNKEEMQSIYEAFQLSKEDKEILEQVKSRELKVIALTEDWCGDAMLNNPILLRIAEEGGIETRFLLRDQNLELMDQYLTNGTSRAIPIFIFIDQEGNEVGVWGPRAPQMQEMVDKGRAGLPEKEAPDFQEKQMDMYRKLMSSYQTDEKIWRVVSGSILGILLK